MSYRSPKLTHLYHRHKQHSVSASSKPVSSPPRGSGQSLALRKLQPWNSPPNVSSSWRRLDRNGAACLNRRRSIRETKQAGEIRLPTSIASMKTGREGGFYRRIDQDRTSGNCSATTSKGYRSETSGKPSCGRCLERQPNRHGSWIVGIKTH